MNAYRLLQQLRSNGPGTGWTSHNSSKGGVFAAISLVQTQHGDVIWTRTPRHYGGLVHGVRPPRVHRHQRVAALVVRRQPPPRVAQHRRLALGAHQDAVLCVLQGRLLTAHTQISVFMMNWYVIEDLGDELLISKRQKHKTSCL